MFTGLAGKALLPNILKGDKTFGATFTADTAGGVTSAPTLLYDQEALLPVLITQSIPQGALGSTNVLDLPLNRRMFVTKIWVIKTGNTGAAADSLVVSMGPVANAIATISLTFPNGQVINGTTVNPQYMQLEPTTAAGFIRLTYTAALFASDTRCIVCMLCQRYGDA